MRSPAARSRPSFRPPRSRPRRRRRLPSTAGLAITLARNSFSSFCFLAMMLRVEQPVITPPIGLQAVGRSRRISGSRLAGLLLPLRRVAIQRGDALLLSSLSVSGRPTSRRYSSCAMVSRRGVEPGLPETNTSSSSAAPFGIPLQVVLAVDRLAVLVNAEQRHVEVVARIGEVVRIAAEESDLLFRREHQAHVGVLLVAVEPVFAALVERNHVGAQAGLLLGFRARSAAITALARRKLSLRRDFAPCTASVTRAVTFSIETRTFTSRSGDFISSLGSGGVEAVPEVVVLGAWSSSAIGRAPRGGWSAAGRAG